MTGRLTVVLRDPPVPLHDASASSPPCSRVACPSAFVRKLRFVLPLVAFSLLVVVFVPGIGQFSGGSSRWVGVGPIQVQPSELMKLAIVVFAADLLARRFKRADHWHAVVRPLLLFMALAAVLDHQAARPRDRHRARLHHLLDAVRGRRPAAVLAGSGVSVLAIGSFLALSATYRRDRLLSFVNPFAHASTTGYQVVQSLATLGLGGVTGSGVGGSVTPLGYLPNAHTDFVFAVIAGNLGLVGALVVLAGFAAFGWAGFRIAARERDPFARFLAVGVTCWVLAQAVINIGGVVDALPGDGHPAPVHLLRRLLARGRAAGGRAAVRDRPAPGRPPARA